TNILSGREMRDVDRALHVMDDNIQLLSGVLPKMDEADKERAELYLNRIAQLQTLFKFAQLLITSVLNRVADMDLKDISRIEIG
ncbi:MAG TPA: hypothetical protein PLZ51_03310, partial [Aggregatilineales bacterium]|nr:hypothetical protein [Aggregatilineales bacterium]